MCGRFACNEIPKPLADIFNLILPPYQPRYNLAPSQQLLALINDPETSKPIFHALTWGLVPFWAKDKTIGQRMINARAETAAEKPSFRAAIRYRRCLIPASGFYEWAKAGKEKQPYYIHLADNQPFTFGGLWEIWESPEGEVIMSCAILTTDANQKLSPIHNRMPVIIGPDNWQLWMDSKVQVPKEIAHLLSPCADELISLYPVGKYVNSPRSDGPECVQAEQNSG
ncbi:MAG: SOS response-associated peptidase [Planctomycetes bacterium]|nr:SOS response-associated peptidase [Planctomycetota bacterium]